MLPRLSSIFTPFGRRITAPLQSAAIPSLSMCARPLSTTIDRLEHLRNIGISAHIDSGKTTLTERILFYTGRIRDIHEVRGKDGVGAKMDSMELEREKGITIQSAATYTSWGDNHINIIDTPGHVDFTIEVERALRVLDGAVLVLCGVSGVQSQTLTVDRQMKRYNVPRLVFINKLDRQGANPFRVVSQLREKLRISAAALQIPIGVESDLNGVVDLIRREAVYFDGEKGETVRRAEVPENLIPEMEKRRHELIERLAEADDEVADIFLNDEEPSEQLIRDAVRRSTLALKFAPVFMGSAYKNKGVQELLDGVCEFLPKPHEVGNHALDFQNNEARVDIDPKDPEKPFVGLAFKLEESKFGQLTYMRVYQGIVKKGDFIHNSTTGKKVKVPRLVRMHSNEMEDVTEVGAGEICAMFGVDCASGETFTDGTVRYGMSTMFVPEPVISLSVTPTNKSDPSQAANFSKALNRFSREDPTFRVTVDQESGQTLISGMGELHLEIYVERLKREYKVDVVTGQPYVAYRETIRSAAPFNYTHKKQSGGAGQYGRVLGVLEPMTEYSEEEKFEFVNELVGNNIPPQYVPACEKGFKEAVDKGSLIGHPVWGVRVRLQDGQSHAVDSSEMAFKIASTNALRSAYMQADPCVLEPIMKVQVEVPNEFQGVVIGGLNQRKGVVTDTETMEDYCAIEAEVPLSAMFGFSTELRSWTQGKGEFTMEYLTHQPVPRSLQEELVRDFEKKRLEKK